jgi:WD40 repeat protein
MAAVIRIQFRYKTRIKLTDSTFTGKFGFAQDKPRILGKSVKHPNLLQIWRLKKMKDYSFQSFDIPFINMMGQESHQSLNPMNQKHDDTVVPSTSGEPNTSVELTYCIGLDKRGPTWKVSWSPHDFVSNNNNSDKGIYKNLLGVLAIVCGDGSCLVLILPKLIHDYKYYRKKYFNVIDNENQIPDTQDHQKIHVLAESRVCRWEIKMNRNPVMSVSWNPHVSGQLCCGMLDGTITIWNLPMHNSDNASGDTSNQQPVNEPAGDSFPFSFFLLTKYKKLFCEYIVLVQNIKLKKTKMKLSVPSVLFTDVIVDPFTPAVTCARFCPYHPHLLASSGFDGVIKVLVFIVKIALHSCCDTTFY